MAIQFTLPMKLESLANQRMGWRKKAKLAKTQRGVTLAKLLSELKPIEVTITRLGPRMLDDDNLTISAKHVRDGIAQALGVNDGDRGKIRFTVLQAKDEQYGTEVRIKWPNEKD